MQTARTQDPAVVASQNYRVLLENERMRALEYRSKPGDRTALHAHPACLIYSFCPSTIQITTSYGANAEYEFKAGEVSWMDESAHRTENIGATDAHLLIVEFKEPPMEREAWHLVGRMKAIRHLRTPQVLLRSYLASYLD